MCFDKFRIGDFRDTPLRELWYGELAQKARHAIEHDNHCETCDFFKFCINASKVNLDDPMNWTNEECRARSSPSSPRP